MIGALVVVSGTGCATTASLPELPEAAAPLAAVSMLTGCWQTEEVFEQWSPAVGDTMVGHSVTVRPGKPTGFEFMRIHAGEQVVLHAQPGGRAPAVPFTLVSEAEGELVFENPAHDFPQRVTYRRVKGGLVAEIGGMQGPPAVTWAYRRVACGRGDG